MLVLPCQQRWHSNCCFTHALTPPGEDPTIASVLTCAACVCNSTLPLHALTLLTPPSPPPQKAAGSAPPPHAASEATAQLQQQLALMTASMRQEEAEKLALEQEVVSAQAEARRAQERLGLWLGAVAQQAAAMAATCEAVMAGDPDAPMSHAQQKLLEAENEAATRAREATATAASAAGGGGADGDRRVNPVAESGEWGKEEALPEAAASTGIDQAAAPAAACAPGPSEVPVLAAGCLAQGAGALSEAQPMLVLADWRWEQLSDCLERLVDWGSCLLDKKMQVQGMVDLRVKLEAGGAELAASRAAAAALEEALEAADGRVAELDARIRADEEDVKRIKWVLCVGMGKEYVGQGIFTYQEYQCERKKDRQPLALTHTRNL